MSMAICSDVREGDLNCAIEELRKYGTVDVIRNMTILSVVGKQMKQMIGIAGKIFSTLAESNVNLEMISQGLNVLLQGIDNVQANIGNKKWQERVRSIFPVSSRRKMLFAQ